MSKKCDETCIVIRTIVIRISSFCPTMTYRISCYCNIVGVAHYSTNTFIYIDCYIMHCFVSNQIDSGLQTIYKLYIVHNSQKLIKFIENYCLIYWVLLQYLELPMSMNILKHTIHYYVIHKKLLPFILNFCIRKWWICNECCV